MVRGVAGQPRNSSRDVVWVGESRIQVLSMKKRKGLFIRVTRAFGASHPGVGSDWLLSSWQQVFHAEWAAATPSAAMWQLGGAVTRVYRRDFRRWSIQRGFGERGTDEGNS